MIGFNKSTSLDFFDRELWQGLDLNPSTIIVKYSDAYPGSHFRGGIFVAVLFYAIFYFLPYQFEDPIISIYVIQLGFILGYVLCFFKRWKRFFTFKHEMKEEVFQKALESMYDYGQFEENYFFIFISVMEKRLEIIPSSKALELIKEEKLRSTLKGIKKNFSSNKPEESLKVLIKHIEDEMRPLNQVNKDTLPVIEEKPFKEDTKIESKNSLLEETEGEKKETPENNSVNNSKETPQLNDDQNDDKDEREI